MLHDFFSDLRYGARQLRNNPLLTAVCVITLALGIGANTAIFSAVYTVLLRPLPFRDPQRLFLISEYNPGNVAKTGSPLARYQSRAARTDLFEESAAYWNVSGSDGVVFGGRGSAQRSQFTIATRSFFSLLGVQPRLGRGFTSAEDVPGAAKVFLASDALWKRAMGADPQAIGRTFDLDGEPHTLVGVLPHDFNFPRGCDIWMPLGILPASKKGDRISHEFWMIGRLRDGVTAAQAQAEMNREQEQLARVYPATDTIWRVRMVPLLDELVGNVRTSLWVLFSAVGFVLLIACSNVINLLLAHSVAREREFAVRAALGAQRMRLVRQSVAEVSLLVSPGAVMALILARLLLGAILLLSAGSIPRLDQPHLSPAVFAFAALLVFFVTLIVAAVPALQQAAPALALLARGTTSTPHSKRLRHSLVIAETAFTLLLLTGAGLMLRSFQQLRRVDPVFRPDGVVNVRVALPDAAYPRAEQRAAFLRELLRRLAATPGMTTVAATDRLPLSGERSWSSINIVGRPQLEQAQAPAVESRSVSEDYFGTLGIPLLRGRSFTAAEVAAGSPVTVINRAMADQFWPGGDPLGQKISSAYHPERPAREIIGVVGNVKDFALDVQAPAEMYTPYGWWNVMNVLARSDLNVSAVERAVRDRVAELDRSVPVYAAASMDDWVGRSMAQQRFDLFLLSLFALTALVLAAVGLYGVLAFSVNRRQQEIGVRLALGATPRSVQMLVVAQGMKLIALGVAAGLVASLLLADLIRTLLFQVSAEDPRTLASVVALLAITGGLASLLPARRAMRTDPAVALRSE